MTTKRQDAAGGDAGASSDPDRTESAPPSAWRVVIADDHEVTRTGIRLMLTAIEGVEVIGEAGDGVELVQACARLSPDAVLTDLDMPRLDGLSALKRIKQDQPDIVVLVLTVHDDGDNVFDAMRAGASGYLAKSASVSEVTQAVHALRSGDTYLTPEVAGVAIRSLTRRADEAEEASRVEQITTPREREVLQLLSEGLSARAIASRLGISERTVNTHVGHVYRKLGVNNRVDAVLAGMRLGLIDEPS